MCAEMNFAEHVLGATTEVVTSRQPPSPLGAATAPEPEASRQRNRATLKHTLNTGGRNPGHAHTLTDKESIR